MTRQERTEGYRIYTTAFDAEVSAEKRLQTLEQGLELPQAAGIPIRAPVTPADHFGERPLVTLLVDHSGSLRGAPALWAMSALREAGALLEVSGIPFEILGFTTVRWHGGKSRRKWLAERDADSWTPFPADSRICCTSSIRMRAAVTPHGASPWL